MDRELVERRILDAMASACRSEMRWGFDDCALWVADILWPVLGYDPMAEFRGRYSSKTGAYRLIGRGGLRRSMERMAIERAWAWTPASRADVGALSIVRMTTGAAVVICRAPGWFIGRAQHGFSAVPAHKIEQAWTPK